MLWNFQEHLNLSEIGPSDIFSELARQIRDSLSLATRIRKRHRLAFLSASAEHYNKSQAD